MRLGDLRRSFGQAVAAGKWREGDSVAQNLMGVILGPRGNSHKALVASSRSKIELRGKGSQKNSFSTKYTHGEHEEFHVYISAPVSHNPPCAPLDEHVRAWKQPEQPERWLATGR